MNPPGPDGKVKDYCARTCCTGALHAALELKERYPRARITSFYQDIRTYGRFHEEYYERAAEKGVLFVRYDPHHPPRVERDTGDHSPLVVRASDLLTGGLELEVPADLVVLATGVVPHDISELISMYRCAVGYDSFLLEVHPKLRPVELAVSGVFLAGLLPGADGHHGGLRRRLGRRLEGRGAHRAGPGRDGPVRRPRGRGAVHRLPDLPHRLPLRGHHPGRGPPREPGQRGALHRLRDVRRQLPEQRDPAVRVHRRAGDLRGGHAARAGAGAGAGGGLGRTWPWPRRPPRSRPPWEPRIIAFLCYWCSYTGADTAGTARLKYPPNVDIIRVMCSGRIDPELMTAAFAKGADGVMVCGCHIGDCHYIAGNHKTMARMPLVARTLVQLGIEPRPVRPRVGERRGGGEVRGARRADHAAGAAAGAARLAAADARARGAGTARTSGRGRSDERGPPRAERVRQKIAMYWAASCGGCDISLLEIGPHLLELVEVADVVFWPCVADFKYRDVAGYPDGYIDVCFFNGAVRNSEQEEIARLLRRKSKTLVAYGACAVDGGIPALANLRTVEAIFDAVYLDNPSIDNPDGVLPQTRTRDASRRADAAQRLPAGAPPARRRRGGLPDPRLPAAGRPRSGRSSRRS